MAVTITLSQAGATNYELRDFDGDIIGTGPITGASFTVLPPDGGWKCGWYRVYCTGPNNDSVYGNSYGVTNFLVTPQDSNFPTLPASTDGYFGAYIPSGTGATDAQAAGVGDPLSFGGQYGYGYDSPVENITRACLGIGMGRLSLLGGMVGHENSSDDSKEANQQAMSAIKDWWLTNTKGGVLDPVRTRYQWLAMPGGLDFDQIYFWPTTNTGLAWIHILPLNPGASQSNIYCLLEAGTSSGYKLTVRYPDSATIVETYDNVASDAAMQTAVNTTSPSAYIRAFVGDGGTPDMTQTMKQMPTTFRGRMIAAVSLLYPLGITHFEGPYNEPNCTNAFGKLVPLRMKAFQQAVHDGNASAKAIGFCPVNITDLNSTNGSSSNWKIFLDAGGGAYLDEISFHTYNCIINSDANLGRNTMETFREFLASYNAGYENLPMWQTEATHAITSVGGVFMPRRARIVPVWWILWQQYGIPHERNPYWYDWSHGFWGYPSMLFTNYSHDKSPNPQAGLLATLARETYGKLYHHRVDFGSVDANAIFLGSVYGAAASGSVMTLQTMSYIPSSSVTLTISGTTNDITVVDAWGNESAQAQSLSKITVNVSDIPTYVRLPSGVNATVYSVNDWGATPSPNVAAAKYTSIIGTKNLPALADGQFMTRYNALSSVGLNVSDQTTLPDTVEVKFYAGDTPTVERVIVWCGPCYQNLAVLLDYDVQTWDGTTWTTQVTVTKSEPASFRSGSNFTNAGCEVESYAKEQWIEDIKFPTPVVCKGVRLYVRQLSYGGGIDLTAANVNNWHGDSTLTPQLSIQDISIVSSTAFSSSDYATTILADSPVGYWRLGESPGATTAVSQVNSPTTDGAYAGTMNLGSTGAIAGDTSLSLASGQNGSVTVAASSAINTGDTITVECWWRNTINFSTSFGIIQRSTTFGWHLGVDTTGTVYFGAGSQNGTKIVTSSIKLSVGLWAHIVFTKSGSTSKLYINGVDVTVPGTNVTLNVTSPALTWGGANNMDYDEVAIYGTALTATQVLNHYRAGSLPGAPSNARAPELEGTTVVGDQVRCLPGRWTPTPNAYSYQWQSSATSGGTYANITGATSSVYTLTSGESTKYVRCQVTASTVGGTSSAVSSDVLGPVS